MTIITLTCSGCDKSVRVCHRPSEQTKATCPHCGTFAASCHDVGGSVYILSNVSMPGILKIGFTTRTAHERAFEVGDSTGVPTPFDIEAEWFVADPQKDEKVLHNLFSLDRISACREFFRIEIGAAIAAITRALKESPDFIRDSPPKTLKSESNPRHYANGPLGPRIIRMPRDPLDAVLADYKNLKGPDKK